MTDLTASPIVIPVVDVRNGGPVRHAREGHDRMLALRAASLAWFPRPLLWLLPFLDWMARRWLIRSKAPYVAEIELMAAGLGFPGVWFLNNSYQWCCTALARDGDRAPWLARTLDWPLDGLGRHVEVARMQGPAGEFFSVTWPGFVGTLTAMAPQRFAAAINQAPLHRQSRHPWLRPYDFLRNALGTWFRVHHIPPDQLLRLVCETCRTYAQARAMLETVPVARPVLFTLAGCRRGERCVIERTEEGFTTQEGETIAANDWLESNPSWEARVAGDLTLVTTYDEAAENSRTRRVALGGWRRDFVGRFDWVTAPVLNRFTRIAVEMCPAEATLRVLGYELLPGADLPQPVTAMRELTPELAA